MLENALIRIALNPAVKNYAPAGARIAEHLREASQDGDSPVRENSLIALYHHLHATGARYKKQEEEALDTWKGLGCLPGRAGMDLIGRTVEAGCLRADIQQPAQLWRAIRPGGLSN